MTSYIGICDFCMEAHTFLSQGARDDWENDHHTRHNEPEPEPVDKWTQDTEAGAIG